MSGVRVRVRDLDRPLAGIPPSAGPAPSEAERQAVAGLLAMVEGSPVLNGNQIMAEEQERVWCAVGDMRRMVADTSLLLPEDSCAQPILTAMRAACRRYMDEAELWDRRANRRYSMPSFTFFQSLGGLKAALGLNIWRLAETYDLEVEARLAAHFPGARE